MTACGLVGGEACSLLSVACIIIQAPELTHIAPRLHTQRLAGDMSHVFSMLILLLRLRVVSTALHF